MLGVHDNPAVNAVDDQQRLAGKHCRYSFHPFRLRRRIAGTDITVHKVLRRFYLFQILDLQPYGDHALEHLVLGITVDHPQLCLFAANAQRPAYHVKAAPYAQ